MEIDVNVCLSFSYLRNVASMYFIKISTNVSLVRLVKTEALVSHDQAMDFNVNVHLLTMELIVNKKILHQVNRLSDR